MPSYHGSVQILVEQGGNFYPCQITHAQGKLAYVQCPAAAIDDEYHISDIAALVIDLPALIEAEKKYVANRSTLK
jgi:hypothetical protein